MLEDIDVDGKKYDAQQNYRFAGAICPQQQGKRLYKVARLIDAAILYVDSCLLCMINGGDVFIVLCFVHLLGKCCWLIVVRVVFARGFGYCYFIRRQGTDWHYFLSNSVQRLY